MAFSVSPSVIVREVDASASVPAIATPPAAIAGVFRWGPVGETVLVSSENELVERFGEPNNDNYETFFVAADYLSYANALYVARVDNGAVKASASDIQTNANTGDVIAAATRYGAFEALYPGKLGNSLEVAYVLDTAFENAVISLEVPAVDDGTEQIPATRLTGNTQVSQTLNFNSTSIVFELAPENAIAADTFAPGDVVTIGNTSVGYQDISVASFTDTTLKADGTATSNTSLIASHEFAIGLNSAYTLAETDLSKLTIDRKWKYASSFGKKPQTGNYHVLVKDKDGAISGDAGTILELYTDVSTSPTAKLSDGSSNYVEQVIENKSS